MTFTVKHWNCLLVPFVVLGLSEPGAAFGQDAAMDSSAALRGALAIPPEPEPKATSLDRSHGQDWHRVSFQLYGSMCPACLLELQGKLRKVDGVAYAKINREVLTSSESSDKHHPKSVLTIVICDEHAAAWDKVQDVIKRSFYKCSHIDDAGYN
jgi:hypothetical protein